jgi:hypothetical protein
VDGGTKGVLRAKACSPGLMGREGAVLVVFEKLGNDYECCASTVTSCCAAQYEGTGESGGE